MLDDKLLEAFMKGFYGYGTWGAKYWFVGLEEGGGQSAEEVGRRLCAWHQRGRTEIDDICEFHRDAELTNWFEDGASLQPTWTPLIRTVLVAEGKPADEESILKYQKMQFGMRNGETIVIERLPLPSPRDKIWKYDKWSTLPCLRSRTSYRQAVLNLRESHIAELIKRHAAKVVVFYGNRRNWSRRFRLRLSESRFDAGWCSDTLVITTDHPGAWSNDAFPRFTAIGEYIRQQPQNRPAET